VFVAAFIGANIHVLILCGINVLYFLVVITNQTSGESSIHIKLVNILMLIFSSVLIYSIFWQIEKSLIENDNYKKEILKHKTELLTIKVEEERTRILRQSQRNSNYAW